MAEYPTELYSQIAPNLFMGGTNDDATIDQPQILQDLTATNEFDCVVTLYAWAAPAGWGVEERRFGFPDSHIIDEYIPIIVELAQWAHAKWSAGKRLNIRCQAGLNRSGLVTALTLMISGKSAADAIELIRTNRSEFALCNSYFERWLLSRGNVAIEQANFKKSA